MKRRLKGLIAGLILLSILAAGAETPLEKTLFGMVAYNVGEDEARALNALATAGAGTYETANLTYTITAYAFDGSLLVMQMLVEPKDGQTMLISDYANEIDDPYPGANPEEHESFAERAARQNQTLRFAAILDYGQCDGNPLSLEGSYCEAFNEDGSMYLRMEERLYDVVTEPITLKMRFYDFAPGEERAYELLPVTIAPNVGPAKVTHFAVDAHIEATRFDRFTLISSPLSSFAILSGRVDENISSADKKKWSEWFLTTDSQAGDGWYLMDEEGRPCAGDAITGGERRACEFFFGYGAKELQEIVIRSKSEGGEITISLMSDKAMEN